MMDFSISFFFFFQERVEEKQRFFGGLGDGGILF
jgi:hypothetical protein